MFIEASTLGIKSNITTNDLKGLKEVNESQILNYIQKMYPEIIAPYLHTPEYDDLENTLIIQETLSPEQTVLRNSIQKEFLQQMHDGLNIKVRQNTLEYQLRQQQIALGLPYAQVKQDIGNSKISDTNISGSSHITIGSTNFIQSRNVTDNKLQQYDRLSGQIKTSDISTQSPQRYLQEAKPLDLVLLTEAVDKNVAIEQLWEPPTPSLQEYDVLESKAELAKQTIAHSLLLRSHKLQANNHTSSRHEFTSLDNITLDRKNNDIQKISKRIQSVNVNSMGQTHQHLIIQRAEHLHQEPLYDIINDSIKYGSITSLDDLFSVLGDLHKSDQTLTSISRMDATAQLLNTASQSETLENKNKYLTNQARSKHSYATLWEFGKSNSIPSKNIIHKKTNVNT